jgi:hypothetical protein
MTPTTDDVVDALRDALGASTIQHDPVRAQQMADLAILRARSARRRRLPVIAAVVAAMLAVAGVAAASTGCWAARPSVPSRVAPLAALMAPRTRPWRQRREPAGCWSWGPPRRRPRRALEGPQQQWRHVLGDPPGRPGGARSLASPATRPTRPHAPPPQTTRPWRRNRRALGLGRERQGVHDPGRFGRRRGQRAAPPRRRKQHPDLAAERVLLDLRVLPRLPTRVCRDRAGSSGSG